MPPTHFDIGFLIFDGALATSISLPMELLNTVNHLSQRARRRSATSPKPIQFSVIGLDSGPVTMSTALSVLPSTLFDPDRSLDMLIIPSRWRHPHRGAPQQSVVQSWLRKLADEGCEICAVGNGSYFLAEAGLLNHRPATTHWHYFSDFSRRYPQVDLKRDYLITQSASLYCTGSVNAAADLLIHLIDRHWGPSFARHATQQFSPESRRPFATTAYSEERRNLHGDEAIALMQNWLNRHYADTVSVAEMATRCGISERSFQRRFKQAAGVSAQQYVQNLRLDAARELLQNSNLSIEEISQHCGYSDSSYFCRQFRRRLGNSPAAYRQAVRRKLFAVDQNPHQY